MMNVRNVYDGRQCGFHGGHQGGYFGYHHGQNFGYGGFSTPFVGGLLGGL